MSSGQVFVAFDRLLDRATCGPVHLGNPAIAALVVEAIHFGEELHHYEMHAFAVMPNHVHLLATPKVELPRLLKSLKGVTARRANLILGLTGQAFWAQETFDRTVRNAEEFVKIRAYIEQNPVRAGLVANAEDFAWSSRKADLRSARGPRPGDKESFAAL